MQKPSRSYWLLQLAVWSCLCLATLPESSAEQIQGSEGFEIGLEVISSKLKKSTHTVQLFLTNRSKTAIDPAQYRLKVLGTPDPTLKVYVKNTSGDIVELVLNKPINLASLIGTKALPIGAVSQFTLIVNSTKAPKHLQLILSIENVPGNTVSKPVEVTWPRKPPQTRFKILIGIGLIALAAVIKMLRRPSSPDSSPGNIAGVAPNVNLDNACLYEAADSLDGLCLGAENIVDQIVTKIGDQIANIVDQIAKKIGERPVEQGSSAVSPQNSELAKLVYNPEKASNTPHSGAPSPLNTSRSGSTTTFVSLPRISDKAPEDHRSVPRPTSHSDTSAAHSSPPVLNVSPAGVRSSKSRLQIWLSKPFIRGSNSKKRNGERSGPEQDTSQRVAEQGNGKRSGPKEGGRTLRRDEQQASFKHVLKKSASNEADDPPTLRQMISVVDVDSAFEGFPKNNSGSGTLGGGNSGEQVEGKTSGATEQLDGIKRAGSSIEVVSKLAVMIMEQTTGAQLSKLEELSKINDVKVTLKNLGQDIQYPTLFLLPLVRASENDIQSIIQCLEPKKLITRLISNDQWKACLHDQVMQKAQNFLRDEPSDLVRSQPLSQSNWERSSSKLSSSASNPLGKSSANVNSHLLSRASDPLGKSSEENPVRMLVAIIIDTNQQLIALALKQLLRIENAQAILGSLSKDIEYPILADLWDKLSPLDDSQTPEDDLKKIIQDLNLNPQVLITKIIENKKWSSSLSPGRIARARQFLAKQAEIAVVEQLITIGITQNMQQQLDRLKALTQMQNAQQAIRAINKRTQYQQQEDLEKLLNKWTVIENLENNSVTQTVAWGINKTTKKKAIIRSLLSHYRQDLLQSSQDIVAQADTFLSC